MKTALITLGLLVILLVIFTIKDTNDTIEVRELEEKTTEVQFGENEGDVDASDTKTVEEKPVTSGKSLDLSGTGLTKVPSNVFSQTSLVSLDLSNNKLDSALQAEVRHLSRLVTLDLSDNNFTGVPAEVGQLKELRYLDLSNNQLTGLPYELGNLQKLETLDLRGNEYAQQDLAIIRDGLPGSTTVLVD